MAARPDMCDEDDEFLDSSEFLGVPRGATPLRGAPRNQELRGAREEITFRSYRSHLAALFLILLSSMLTAPAGAAGGDTGSVQPQAMEALRQLQAEHFPNNESGGASWSTGTYIYDPAGNISAIGSQYFLYDTTERLQAANVTAAAGSLRQDYDYDEYGNMTSTEMPGLVTPIPTDSTTNRLNGASVQYDAAGNMTQTWSNGSTISYKYDSLSMLQQLSDTRGNNIVYVYTTDDQRIWTYDLPPNVSHWAIRDLEGKVLRDFVQTGETWSLGKDYFYRDGMLLAAHAPSGVTEHFSLDHLGTPRLITDQNHGRIGFHVYFPFGIEWFAVGQHESPAETMRFTGHERDQDLSGSGDFLDYMHARYYSAKMGRFSSVDQGRPDLKKPQSWNRYAYTMNSPINNTDPDGRETNPVTGKSYILDSQILVSKNNPRKGFFGPVRRNADGSPKKHGGNDIKAPRGTPVFAPVTGTVVQSAWAGGDGGYVLRIRRANDENGQPVYVHISHLNGPPSVKVGDTVVEGQPNIAEVGNTGNAKNEDPHAHTAVMVGGQKKENQVDPQQWFRDHPSNAQPEKPKGNPCEGDKKC